MFAQFLKIIYISRPHLWLYTLGSFLFGIHVAALRGYTIDFLGTILLTAIVTVPTNFALYALNDYYDAVSDSNNPKKNKFEYKAVTNEHWLYNSAIVVLGIITVFFISLGDYYLNILFLIWLVAVLLYNAPPFRFKARPGLDMVCAIIYPIWGVIGYISAGGVISNYWFILSLFLLSSSFHLYSAIQDIPYDASAGIMTSAVFISSPTLNILICMLLVSLAILPIIQAGLIITGIVLSIYIIFYSLHLWKVSFCKNSTQTYQYFIYTHFVVGIITSLSLFMYH